MQHRIDPEELGPSGLGMTRAVQACVHCGFCLPACPTYGVLGQEMDSPRGRIVLMKEVLEGGLPWEAALPHIDRCLGCLACEPACPSGVSYRELVGPFRERAETVRRRSWSDRLRRVLLMETLPYPRRFRLAAAAGIWVKRWRRLLPRDVRPLLDLLPDRLPRAERWPQRISAEGETRARVGLLPGCAQSVLEPGIQRATIEILRRNGVELWIPAKAGCCGALAWHSGDGRRARAAARVQLEAYPGELDAVVTNAAGCGSAMREYGTLFLGQPEEKAAGELAGRVRDICEFLDQLGPRPAPGFAKPVRVAYQDACHLAHAQGVREAPRRLLRATPGVELVELAEGHLCCGSAGTYNLEQPEIAAELGEYRARTILDSGCEVAATGNIGCLTQMRYHLQRLGSRIRVLHTVEVLAAAARGKWPDGE
ncbi:MAG TPA: heterodisulfide reductase-related iron-sulfur binding cluster [Verrucomicrobiales bacterium]|nr:heterodisulfide reductase-related iron-sulfur binding cluster [Verrucomicrobiales bacterium]